MANLPAPTFPIIIDEWERNSREIVRVALDRYNGRETIDVRAWWRDGEGNWRPGRSGLTLGIKYLPALAEGLADALRRAQALSLIADPEAAPCPGRDRTVRDRAAEERTAKDRTAAERQRRYRQRRNGVTPQSVTA